MLSGILCRAVTCVLQTAKIIILSSIAHSHGTPSCLQDHPRLRLACVYVLQGHRERPEEQPQAVVHLLVRTIFRTAQSHALDPRTQSLDKWTLWMWSSVGSLSVVSVAAQVWESEGESESKCPPPSPSHSPRTSSRVQCAGLLLSYIPPWSDSRTCSCSGVLSPCSAYCFDSDWPLLYVASSVGDRWRVHTYLY